MAEVDFATGLGSWQTVSVRLVDEEQERIERELQEKQEAEVAAEVSKTCMVPFSRRVLSRILTCLWCLNSKNVFLCSSNAQELQKNLQRWNQTMQCRRMTRMEREYTKVSKWRPQ